MSKISVLSPLKTYVHTCLSDEFHLLGIALVLSVIALFHPMMFLVVMIYGWLFRKRLNFLAFAVMAGLLLGVLVFRGETVQDVQGDMRVVWIEPSLYGDRLTLRQGLMRLHYYAQEDQYRLGDTLYVKGTITPYRNKTIPGGFDAKRYHLASGVLGTLVQEQVLTLDHDMSLSGLRARLYVTVRDRSDDPYILSYLFGTNTFDTFQDALIDDLGIAYLLSLSGLHLYALLSVLKSLMWRLDVKTRYQRVIELLIFVPILYLGGFSIGTFRVFIQIVVSIANRYFKLGMNRLDRLFMVFYLILLIRPLAIFEPGLPITFSILFSLIMLEGLYERKTGYVKGLVISLIASLSAFPFIGSINIVMVIVMPFLVFVLSGPFFLFSVATALFPVLNGVHGKTTDLLEILLLWLQPRALEVVMPEMSFLLVILYLVIMIRMLASKEIQTILTSLLVLMILIFLPAIERRTFDRYEVMFLDVGQGDGAIMITPSCTMVIDAYRNVETVLLAKGIRVIDLLVLTHSDNDHVAEAASLVERFEVNRLLGSPYDRVTVQGRVTEAIKPGMVLPCGKVHLVVLGPLKDYGSPNNNSLVLQFVVKDTTFMFAGDIETEAETDLVRTYQSLLESDVLKVAHHGSKTSSTNAFLNAVDPEIAIISSGVSNHHRFPDPDVITRLMESQVQVYRTDTMGTIVFTHDVFGPKWDEWLPYGKRFWYN